MSFDFDSNLRLKSFTNSPILYKHPILKGSILFKVSLSHKPKLLDLLLDKYLSQQLIKSSRVSIVYIFFRGKFDKSK